METNRTYASFFQRLTGHVLDALILSLPMAVAFWQLALATSTLEQLVSNFLIFITICLAMIFVHAIYHTLFLANTGQTPGKQLAGVKIVTSDGKLLSKGHAFFRELIGKAISGAIFGAGFWWMFKDAQKRTWHDLFVNSIAISTKNNIVVSFITVALLLIIQGYLNSAGLHALMTNQQLQSQFTTLQQEFTIEVKAQKDMQEIRRQLPDASSMPLQYQQSNPYNYLQYN